MITKTQIDQFKDDKANKTKKVIYFLTQEIKYKIGNQIGSGTFGKVYEVLLSFIQAVNLMTGERVAIKEAFQDKKYKNR